MEPRKASDETTNKSRFIPSQNIRTGLEKINMQPASARSTETEQQTSEKTGATFCNKKIFSLYFIFTET